MHCNKKQAHAMVSATVSVGGNQSPVQSNALVFLHPAGAAGFWKDLPSPAPTPPAGARSGIVRQLPALYEHSRLVQLRKADSFVFVQLRTADSFVFVQLGTASSFVFVQLRTAASFVFVQLGISGSIVRPRQTRPARHASR